MKKEFITSTGKIIVDGDVLQITQLKERYGSRHNRYFMWLFVLFIINVNVVNTKPLSFVIVTFSGVVLMGYVIYFIYRNQWRNRFHLSNIKSLKIESDESGLETTVVLYFKSNTAKEIDFRTSESQHEAFVQYIEQQITHIQLA